MDGMEVVAVSLDQSREDLEGFVKEKKIPWTQIFYPPKSGTPNPLAEKYGINAIPAMYLIGKDGNVVSKVNAHDKESLEKAVAEELKKAPKTAG